MATTPPVGPASALHRAKTLFRQRKVGDAISVLESSLRKAIPIDAVWMELLEQGTSLLIELQDFRRARRWISRFRGRLQRRSGDGRNSDDEIREIDLLEQRAAYAEHSVRCKSAVGAAFGVIRWWKPWMVEFRLRFLMHTAPKESFLSELHQLRRWPIERGTTTYSRRVILLGYLYYRNLRPQKCVALLRSGLRLLENVPRLDALPVRANTLCEFARALLGTGRSDEAIRALQECETIKRRTFVPGIDRQLQHVWALAYVVAGDRKKVLDILLKHLLAEGKPRDVFHRSHLVATLAHAVQSAAALRRFDQARQLLTRAKRLTRSLPSHFARALVLRAEGDLHRELGGQRAFVAAERCYRHAEDEFRIAQNPTSIAVLAVSRAYLCLAAGDPVGVLKQVTSLQRACGETAAGFVHSADSLFLLSHALLHDNPDRESHYEFILQKLGNVWDPVALFKIIANLYLYSWELGSNVEITATHLKQLDRLRERIPPTQYAHLYKELITDRVMARFQRCFLAARG